MSNSEIHASDREEVASFIEKHWGSRVVMSRGKRFLPDEEEGFIERRDDKIAGLLTYHTDDDGMEILTHNSIVSGEGIGSSLMLNAIEKARRLECRKILLTTTNDKLRAIAFYQRLGFRMVAINLGVVDEARKIKPEIAETGERGVKIQDEIVMELPIKPYIE